MLTYEDLDPFISRADLSAYLRRDLSEDDLALIAVDSACGWLRTECHQAFDLEEDDVVALDSEGTDTILLPELPVREVASVIGPGDLPLTEGSDFVVDREMGALHTKRRGARFLPGRQLYTVTYTHGYSIFPTDLRVLALTLAARIWEQQLVRQESVGGHQVIFGSPESLGLSQRELAVLAKYSAGRRR